jgi:hypothetical protein
MYYIDGNAANYYPSALGTNPGTTCLYYTDGSKMRYDYCDNIHPFTCKKPLTTAGKLPSIPDENTFSFFQTCFEL